MVSHSVKDRISIWDSAFAPLRVNLWRCWQLPVNHISVTVTLMIDVILAEKVAKRKVLVFYS